MGWRMVLSPTSTVELLLSCDCSCILEAEQPQWTWYAVTDLRCLVGACSSKKEKEEAHRYVCKSEVVVEVTDDKFIVAVLLFTDSSRARTMPVKIGDGRAW